MNHIFHFIMRCDLVMLPGSIYSERRAGKKERVIKKGAGILKNISVSRKRKVVISFNKQ